MVKQLPCKQQIVGSIPITSSIWPRPINQNNIEGSLNNDYYQEEPNEDADGKGHFEKHPQRHRQSRRNASRIPKDSEQVLHRRQLCRESEGAE